VCDELAVSRSLALVTATAAAAATRRALAATFPCP
jgi:hypothetical protein